MKITPQDISERYISSDGAAQPNGVRDPRDDPRGAEVRLRDQGRRRRDDALLLGRQLRADLPRAETTLRGRAGGGGRYSHPRPPAGHLRDKRPPRGRGGG